MSIAPARYKLIACEVLLRELCDALARSPHQVDIEYLPKGLHDLGGKAMREKLQELIDRISGVDAILFGYALCGNGLLGLQARSIPLVVPRAHDCIALLMGSRQQYLDYFNANPGVYFRSTGWLERGGNLEQTAPQTSRTGFGASLQELIERYGEDNAQFLFEELNRYKTNYSQLTYIETGLESGPHFEQAARAEAAARGWQFSKIHGDLRLFHALLRGQWDDADFLVVPPGHQIAVTYDDSILRAERIPS